MPQLICAPPGDLVVSFILIVLLAIAVSHLIVGLSHEYWHKRLAREYPVDALKERQAEDRRSAVSLAGLLGRLEVITYTTLLAFSVPGAGAFPIGWVALKMAMGWKQIVGQDSTRFHVRGAMVALALNLMNIIISLAAAGAFKWVCWDWTAL